MTILVDDPGLRRRSSIGRSRIGSGAEARPGDAVLPGSITGILFRLSPARVLVFLLGVAITLAGTSLILQGLYHSGQPVPMGVLVRLDLDRENNIPTWFSSAPPGSFPPW